MSKSYEPEYSCTWFYNISRLYKMIRRSLSGSLFRIEDSIFRANASSTKPFICTASTDGRFICVSQHRMPDGQSKVLFVSQHRMPDDQCKVVRHVFFKHVNVLCIRLTFDLQQQLTLNVLDPLTNNKLNCSKYNDNVNSLWKRKTRSK